MELRLILMALVCLCIAQLAFAEPTLHTAQQKQLIQAQQWQHFFGS